jgi:hypothetical protein
VQAQSLRVRILTRISRSDPVACQAVGAIVAVVGYWHHSVVSID